MAPWRRPGDPSFPPRECGSLAGRLILLAGLSLVVLACAETVTDTVDYGTLEVQSLRRSGDPVPGALAILYNGTHVMDQGITDEVGQLRFRSVPPNVLGPYGIYAEPPAGYLRPEEILGGPSTASVDGLELEEGGTESVQFTYIKEGPGRLEVTVEEPDGKPVEGAEVFVFGPQGDLGQATVDGSGRVVFDPVSFGNRGVRVLPPPGYLYDQEAGLFQDGILVEDGWTESVTFTVPKCPGIIRVRALDQWAQPAEGVRIRLYTATEVVGVQETGANGTTVFGEVGCQDYGVALAPGPGWAWEEGRGKSFFDGIVMTPGDEREFTFSVERRAAEIRVRVQDPAGNPVPGAVLELYNPAGPLRTGVSGADGRLDFLDVPCGQEYGVKINEIPPGYSVTEGRGSSYFDGLDPAPDEVVILTFVLTS